ncbi:MAG: universal stress protein [Pyrinomonadaceae bacterium]|nr:universal stress protein [Pyrinomonadaceae bacterium]
MITIKRILCPIDLSSDSSSALAPLAIELAHNYGAALQVCYCVEETATIGRVRKAQKELEDTIKRALANRKGAVETYAIEWEALVFAGSHPAELITREAARQDVDLIVMCSRRRPLRAALLGSTAERVYRTAPCPVLITHPEMRQATGNSIESFRFKRVLVAHDFSDYSEMALKYAFSLAQEHQAELHLLHVLDAPLLKEPELSWSSATVEGSYHKAARSLQQAVSPETHLWCTVKTAVRWGKPYTETLSYCREQRIDLICMGARGAGFGMHSLIGSNVDRVLRQSPCPVLVARPLSKTSFAPIVSNLSDEKMMIL